jgi:UrcA family protein
MNVKLCCQAAAILATVAMSAFHGPVQAQEPTGEDKSIVVEAPRVIPPPPAHSPYSGAPVATTTIRISALYGDLDLTRPADAARLLDRVGHVAHDACRYLDSLFPLNPDAGCVDRAIAAATPAAQAVIASAGK